MLHHKLDELIVDELAELFGEFSNDNDVSNDQEEVY